MAFFVPEGYILLPLCTLKTNNNPCIASDHARGPENGYRLHSILTDRQPRTQLETLAKPRTSQWPFDQRDSAFGVLSFVSDA
jgi:hypothetical protein